MTNSTEPKPKKVPGPIRTGAVVPTAIIFGLVFAYFTLFFDSHVRLGFEWIGTKIHGAEVNVGDINTSFFKGSFEMLGLQITDKNKPHRNLFQVDRIHFQFLWDGLLRAKFVVDDASITGIQALNPRKTPGYVVPPEPPANSGKGGGGTLQKTQDAVTEQAKTQYKDNFFGDVATVLGGVDPDDQLKNIEGQLKSSTRIKELEAELKAKEAVWKEKLKSLPQSKEIEELGQRVKQLKFDTKNPVEFAKSIKEAEKIFKEADQKVKLVSETGKDLNKDVNTYKNAFKEVEAMVNQDLKDIQSRLKIPEMDAKEFSKALFMRMFQQKLAGVAKYYEVAKEYMPPAKKGDAAQAPNLIPPKRGEGKNYRFPITVGYPLFWLKHAKISSEVSSSAEYSGNIMGEIKDITSDPVYLKRPAIVALQGDFPKQQISGLDFKATLDHTTDTAKETIALKIGGYPVGEQSLADSQDINFAIAKATGGLNLNAVLTGETLDVQLQNAFTNVDYQIEAKNKIIDEILTKVMAGIPVIDVKARAAGTWSSIDFDLSSNLGDELYQGFKQQIQAKIDEAKQKIKNFIDEKIGGEKEKLNQQINQITGEVDGQLKKSQTEIEGAKKTAQADLDKQKKQGSGKKLEQEGKKLLKKLFGN